jgi:hypothetical protein
MRLRSLVAAAGGALVLATVLAPAAVADEPGPDCSGAVADRMHWTHEQLEDRGLDGDAAHEYECAAAIVDPTSDEFILGQP